MTAPVGDPVEYLSLVEFVLRNQPSYFSDEIEDDRQDGRIGLLNAVRTYDARRGVTFATYAYTCIWKGIQAGRRRSHGCNYRRAADRHELYERPLSLDARHPGVDDSRTLGDTLVAPAASDGTTDPLLDHVLALLTDDERVAVLAPIDDAADELGLKKASVRRKRVRTYARIRSQLAEGAR